MAGKIPSFITGANAKIKINNMTMAYAQDVSYSVDVATIPVETIGRYEVVTNEPISYYVSGTLSVIRYTKAASGTPGAGGSTDGTKDNGNSINNWVDTTSGNIGDHFNPANLLASKTFDLEIFSRIQGDKTPVAAANGNEASTNVESIIKIRDCRLTRKTGNVTKRGLIVDQFAFSAVLIDHDDDTAVGVSNSDKDLE